jgi:hypothetical protein
MRKSLQVAEREYLKHALCGCEAKCRIHIEANSGRWYMKLLHNAHNHSLLDEKFRKMSNYDIWRMSTMRQLVGMKTSHIFGLFATEPSSYEKVDYRRREMYLQQTRKLHVSI